MLRKGFSLIELLIVIGIIAVLAAIIFPVFHASREKSRATVCTSNMAEMMKSVLMYAQDYDDKLPGDLVWRAWNSREVSHQDRAIVPCPTFDGTQERGSRETGYAANLRIIRPPVEFQLGSSLSLSQIPYVANTVFATDSAAGEWFKWKPNMCDKTYTCHRTTKEDAQLRHNGGANYSFVDGHIKWYKPEQVTGYDEVKQGLNDGHTPTFAVN